jgi:hypothetical protein
MPILLDNGVQQLFRLRHHDIVLRGMLDDAVPPVRARFRLNDAGERPFHVEELPDRDTDWVNGYKSTPAELRCRELGEICVEIPVADSALRAGRNRLLLRTDDAGGHAHELTITFDWDATALPLPLDLRDLTRFTDIQEVGQALNGAFDLDRKRNVIRSRAPVAPDAYLILGSPHESQEATYAVRFLEPAGAKWLGLSDFMAGQEEGVPARGVKVGWSSAGMAAISPKDGARSFIAWGDHSSDPREWAIATNPAASIAVEKNRLYRVRHQVRFANGINQVRFRIWPADGPEPSDWLCVEQDDRVPLELPRHRKASFGLFQHLGQPIEWSDILVRPLDPLTEPLRPGGRAPFLGRARPGAF